MKRTLMSDFFEGKKDKSFCRTLKKWLGGGSYSDVVIAKTLCSMLTHCFIEMEHIPDKARARLYNGLSVGFQSEMVNKFIRGEVSAGELRECYSERFGAYLRRDR